MKRRTLLSLATPMLLPTMLPGGLHAQGRTVRVIVPYTAGGWGDVSARIVFTRLTQRTGRIYVIENRVGAGGLIGAAFVAGAPPDGSVLLYGTSSLAAVPSLYPRQGLVPTRDLTSIALISRSSLLIVANNDRPERGVADIIATAKATPGGLDWASGGIGTTPHLTAGYFASEAGITLNHVTYRGGTPALNDVVAGQVGFLFSTTGASLTTVTQGLGRAIAHTGRVPLREMPELPAVAATLPGFQANDWYAVLAPARTPAELCLETNAEIMRVLQEPDVLQQLSVPGAEIVSSTPEDLATLLAADTEKWGRVVREAGISGG